MEILIIDNDEALVRSLSILLEDRGHRVHGFTNPLNANDFVRQAAPSDWAPDVVLLDYFMPDMTGEQLARRLQPSLKSNCRVILMSGHTDRLENVDLGSAGIGASLGKPIDFDSLLQLVEQQGRSESESGARE